MNITNKEIIIIFIILIVIVFITNYDVYVVNKNENICKTVKMIKKPIPLIPSLNKYERKINWLAGYIFGFSTLSVGIIETIKYFLTK